MKLHSNGGIEPFKVLQRTLQEWFKTLQSCINSMVMHKTSKDGNMIIDSHEQITTNLQYLKIFFNGIRHRTDAGDIWFTALIGFNNNEEEVCDNTKWWYQEKNGIMPKKSLQVLNTQGTKISPIFEIW